MLNMLNLEHIGNCMLKLQLPFACINVLTLS